MVSPGIEVEAESTLLCLIAVYGVGREGRSLRRAIRR